MVIPGIIGDLGGGRTHNLQLRRLTLYPIELRDRDGDSSIHTTTCQAGRITRDQSRFACSGQKPRFLFQEAHRIIGNEAPGFIPIQFPFLAPLEQPLLAMWGKDPSEIRCKKLVRNFFSFS